MPARLPSGRIAPVPGDVAKWQGSGLQNRDHRFESGRRLPYFELENGLYVAVFLLKGSWSTPGSTSQVATQRPGRACGQTTPRLRPARRARLEHHHKEASAYV